MKVKKQYQKKFTTVDNAVLNDEKLSWKAKGIFVYLWSQSDDWDYYVSEVAKHSRDGQDSLSAGIKELENRGYLKRIQTREGGKFGKFQWLLTENPNEQAFLPQGENPVPVKPLPEKPVTEKPVPKNPPLTITNNNKTKETITKYNNNNSSNTPADDKGRQLEFVDVEKCYQANLHPNGVIPGHIKDELKNVTKIMGPQMVILAIKRAVNQIATPNWKYIKAILQNWHKDGLKTVADVEKSDERFKQQKKQQRMKYKDKVIQKETLPDWAKPGYEEKQIVDDPAKTEKIAELMEKIKS